MRNPIVIALLIVAAGAGRAAALDPSDCDAREATGGGACFGLEPTFHTRALLDDEISAKTWHTIASKWLDLVDRTCAAKKLAPTACWTEPFAKAQALADKCSLGKYGAVTPGQPFRVCLKTEGWKKAWYYEVNADVGVVELQTHPANEAWLTELYSSGLLDRTVFKPAELFGLKPDADYGGGHIHVDIGTAFPRPMALVNFMTEIHNLPFLPLNADNVISMAMSSPPLSVMPDVRDRYQQFVTSSVPAAWGTGSQLAPSITTFINDFNRSVYVRTYMDRKLDLLVKRDQNIYIGQMLVVLGIEAQRADTSALALAKASAEISEKGAAPLSTEATAAIEGLKQLRQNVWVGRWWEYELGSFSKYQETKDLEYGPGWALKAQHLRLASAFGTVEIRNLRAPTSGKEIVALVKLFNRHIRAQQDATTAIALANPTFRKIDGDIYSSFPDAPWRASSFPIKSLFQGDQTFDTADAEPAQIAWQNYVGDKDVACELAGLMPVAFVVLCQ
jgi:hypothetical protein